jgi:hypothetical protein
MLTPEESGLFVNRNKRRLLPSIGKPTEANCLGPRHESTNSTEATYHYRHRTSRSTNTREAICHNILNVGPTSSTQPNVQRHENSPTWQACKDVSHKAMTAPLQQPLLRGSEALRWHTVLPISHSPWTQQWHSCPTSTSSNKDCSPDVKVTLLPLRLAAAGCQGVYKDPALVHQQDLCTCVHGRNHSRPDASRMLWVR